MSEAWCYVGGLLTGSGITMWWLHERFIRTPDPIADGVRQQMRTVKFNRRWVGADYEVTSIATASTADGEFEIVVRQPLSTPSTNKKDQGE